MNPIFDRQGGNSPSFGDLTGRVALVTGAGRGIGPGIVEALADAGADVVINAYTPAFAVPLAERIAKTSGRRVEAVVADATTVAGTNEIVARTVELLDSLDILVNGVGDALPGPLVSWSGDSAVPLPFADVRKVMDLNLTSALLMCQAAASELGRSTAGTVINVAGAAAVKGGAGMVVYAAAKAGVVALTRSLALEWATRGIRVNAVAPGIVPDPGNPGMFDEATAERYLATVPLGRFGTPGDVGALVRFLASDQASYLTGQTIFVDGGLTL
jgi:NAD(P)-dependent dehydrogenase (short-subunit alcohol dehydrogenase family)